MKLLILSLLIFSVCTISSEQRILSTAQECSQCINSSATNWCRDKDNADNGFCCKVNDPRSECQDSTNKVCSNHPSFTISSAKLLCPSEVESCIMSTTNFKEGKAEKISYKIHMPPNDNCQFNIEPHHKHIKTLNIKIDKIENTDLEIYTEHKDFNYEMVSTTNTTQAISLNKKVQRIYFLLQSSQESVDLDFSTKIISCNHHDDDDECEDDTILDDVLETILHFILIDGILMLSVAAILHFTGFNSKLVCMRVKMFNEAQDQKKITDIKAINDQERCPVEAFPVPQPDLEHTISDMDPTKPSTQPQPTNTPTLQNPGLGTIKSIFFQKS
ncbi:unnamed protein product [Moneuplotes crassus]|uniref:Uncharacterized protein n=1 Tax=Euplotes crassus TaxID=5936 RepID=A0AAD1XFS9_EUPCR|nr:unnamed protein product [Moneuplotes crassus]